MYRLAFVCKCSFEEELVVKNPDVLQYASQNVLQAVLFSQAILRLFANRLTTNMVAVCFARFMTVKTALPEVHAYWLYKIACNTWMNWQGGVQSGE